MRRREFIVGLGALALACGLSGVLGGVNSRRDGSPSR
jgi:hypothetical protein